MTKYTHAGKDLTGNQYNEWTILEHEPGGVALFRCSCGRTASRQLGNVLNGTSKSCGHTRTKVAPGYRYPAWTVQAVDIEAQMMDVTCNACGFLLKVHRRKHNLTGQHPRKCPVCNPWKASAARTTIVGAKVMSPSGLHGEVLAVDKVERTVNVRLSNGNTTKLSYTLA